MKAAAPSGPSLFEQAAHQGRADHHAVGHLAHLGGLRRRRHTHAHADRHIGAAPDLLDDLGHVGPQVASLAGDTHARHGVDEAAGPRTNALHPIRRRGRGDEQDRVDPRGIRLERPRSDLFDREVRDDGTAHAGRGHRAGHALVPRPVDEVVVGHDGHGHRGLGPRQCRRGPRRAPSPASGRAGQPLGSPARPSSGPRRGCRPRPRRPRPRSPRRGTGSSRRSCPPSDRGSGACAPVTAGPQLLLEVEVRHHARGRRSRAPGPRPCRRGPTGSPGPSSPPATHRCRHSGPPRPPHGPIRARG